MVKDNMPTNKLRIKTVIVNYKTDNVYNKELTWSEFYLQEII